LANVLVGRLAPNAGTVDYDGTRLTGHRTQLQRRRIQMVFQDPYSSLNPRMTIRRAIGELLRVHDIVAKQEVDGELIRLLRLVGLDEDALDAYPGQFSGGQRQRLAIARALVRQPEVYLFDDSFSALDLATDARLRAALRPLTRDAAVVVVAQRVSTIVDADQIVVLEDGEVVGLGTHETLLAGCPTYAEIVASQQPAGAVA
jgi:ATP-binding cassette subfamily B protein